MRPWIVVPTQNPIGSAAWRRVPVSAAAYFFWAVCDTARGTITNIIARNPPNFFMTSVIPSLVTGCRLLTGHCHFRRILFRQARWITCADQSFSRVFCDHGDLRIAQLLPPAADRAAADKTRIFAVDVMLAQQSSLAHGCAGLLRLLFLLAHRT